MGRRKIYQLKEDAQGYKYLKPNIRYRENHIEPNTDMRSTVKALANAFPDDWIEVEKFTYGK